jgi:hypothetical protein
MTTATGSFEITSFKEDTYEERGEGAKLTHAWGEQAFSGDIEATGLIHWLMSYRPDKTARFVGLQRIDGSIGGRRGSFILESTGDHDGAASHGSWVVVPDSGTGDLTGITGAGSFEAPGGMKVTYELDYRLG